MTFAEIQKLLLPASQGARAFLNEPSQSNAISTSFKKALRAHDAGSEKLISKKLSRKQSQLSRVKQDIEGFRKIIVSYTWAWIEHFAKFTHFAHKENTKAVSEWNQYSAIEITDYQTPLQVGNIGIFMIYNFVNFVELQTYCDELALSDHS